MSVRVSTVLKDIHYVSIYKVFENFFFTSRHKKRCLKIFCFLILYRLTFLKCFTFFSATHVSTFLISYNKTINGFRKKDYSLKK